MARRYLWSRPDRTWARADDIDVTGEELAHVGRPLSPLSAFILHRLEAGPVPYRILLVDAAAQVPPGRGYRESIRTRTLLLGKGRHHKEPIPDEAGKDEAIRFGQRQVVYKTFKNLHARGRIRYEVEGEDRMVHLVAVSVRP